MISVVVPIYLSKIKSYAMTEKCLSLAQKDVDAEWILVETESDFFREYADIHIYERRRTTCTKSLNRGFKVASGDFVVMLTNDVLVNGDWLGRLTECFEKDDCGMATLATTQLGHNQEDKIEEGVWCSTFMIRNSLLKELNYFDEGFVNSWDDTDLVMRTYLKGLKMYRNHNVVVEHNPGQTMYEDANHIKNYNNNAELFAKKHEAHKEHRMYKILTEGWVL